MSAVGDRSASGRSPARSVVFGDKQAANSFRESYPDARASSDDKRERTVKLQSDARDAVVEKAEALAARSRQERGRETERPGQEPLTDAERSRIDFTKNGVNVPKCRSIKAIFHDRGVSDWFAHADLTLTVDENRGLADKARSAGGGDAGLGREGEDRQSRRKAAREAAKHLDKEAERAADRIEDICEIIAGADAVDMEPTAVVDAWADGSEPFPAGDVGLLTERDDVRTIAGELADPDKVISAGLDQFKTDPDTRQLVDRDAADAADQEPDPEEPAASDGFDPLPDWSPADGGAERPQTADTPAEPETPPEPEAPAGVAADAADAADAEPIAPDRMRARGFAAVVYRAEQADGFGATAAAWLRLIRLFLLLAVEDAVNGVVPDAA